MTVYGTNRRRRPSVSSRLLKLDRQYFPYGKSSQAGPETELRRSMNAAYSRLGLAAGARSTLNRMTDRPGSKAGQTAKWSTALSAQCRQYLLRHALELAFLVVSGDSEQDRRRSSVDISL